MKLVLLLAVDYANLTRDGKLNVMGIFREINASQFPAKHPDYPQLRGTIARHNELASGYFQHAVKMIEMLEEMKEVEK